MTLREIQLYASSATQKESYALDYFRHSTRALATWAYRTCGRRVHSYPLSNCSNRTCYPVSDREGALNWIAVKIEQRYREPVINVVTNH